MSKVNFLEEIFNKEVSKDIDKKINEIERLYKAKLPAHAKDFIKFNETQFYNYNESSYRLLAVKEILNANEELEINFVKKELLPLFDTMDNDFICYDFQQDKFCLFNIIEDVKYLTVDSIEEIIKKINWL